MLGLGNPFSVNDLPPGRLRSELQALPEPARHRAMERMHRFDFPVQDVQSLHVDHAGGVFYVCAMPVPGDLSSADTLDEPELSESSVPVSPFPDALKFHSRPGAPNVVYLDFSGAQITGTAWNDLLSRDPIPALAFSTDSDYTTFSAAEQAVIKRVWQRVAEDFAPFNVNVTTEPPATWNNRTAHVLITRNRDANGENLYASNAGGVAYVNVFGSSNYAYYRPAWVYHNNLGNAEAYIAEAASHEAGHNLGLSHDGKTDGTEYYSGHGSGATSWGPIMGASYGRNVTQWSKGDYYLANNTQDDLGIMAGKMGYRADDHGDTFSTASYLTVTNNTLVQSTTPEEDPWNEDPANKGVLYRTSDIDVWSFSSGAGTISLTVSPWTSPANARGGNAHVRATLFDANGLQIAQHVSASDTAATIETAVAEGVYHLQIEGVGTGSPLSSSPSGYVDYASLGQYFISGTVIDASGLIIPPQASLSASDVMSADATGHTFDIIYTDDQAIRVSSLGHGNARVTGPGGYDEAATFVTVDHSTDGTPRTATYHIPAPGTTWTPADNGTYAVWINPESVADTEGAYVAAGTIGTFAVNVPTVIYSANMDVHPGWTLEPQWDYGQPSGTGGMPASGATGVNVIGYNLTGNYGNNLATKYATTPAIDCSGTDIVVLRFQRWLGLGRNDTAIIQVSTDNTNWQTVWDAGKQPFADSAWQAVQYDLSPWAAGRSTVYLRWGMGSAAPNQPRFGWNLDDVEVLGVGDTFDTTPPTASLFAMDVSESGGIVYEFSVTYTDDSGLDVASLGDDNCVVTAPDLVTVYPATLSGVDDTSNGSPRTAFYQITPPGGSWSSADDGDYTIRLSEGSVRDVHGNAIPETLLGTFTVNIVESQTTPGAIQTALDPEAARNQGAQWRLTTGAQTDWMDSGALIDALEPGIYTVTFRALEGWDLPADQLITLGDGETRQLQAAYAALYTTSHPTPIWWLIDHGITEDYEAAVTRIGANGYAFWESYIAGLDPNDPASVFQLSLDPNGDPSEGITLRWNPVSQRTYSIFRFTNLLSDPLPVEDAQNLPATINTYTHPVNDAPLGVFQIRIQHTDP